jgi:hypothetical protein
VTAPRALWFSVCCCWLLGTACGAAGTKRAEPERPLAQPQPSTLPSAGASVNRPPQALPGGVTSAPSALAEMEGSVPVTLPTVGPGGRFLVYCAARVDTDENGRLEVRVGAAGALAGDQLRPELAIGGKPPELIDDLLGYDDSGRYVVVRIARVVSLVDVAGGTRTDLSALGFDDRDDVLPERQHRALAFDPRGELLAYVRKGEPDEVIVRTLVTGAERVVRDVPGEPFRFTWSPDGEWLMVSSAIEDTGQNGRVDFPARLTKTARFSCPSPIPRLSVRPEFGDRPSTFVVRREEPAARRVTDLVMPFGADLLTRAKDGPLVLELGGKQRPLTRPDCGSRVLHADPSRGLLLVACSTLKTPQRAQVELLTPAGRIDLGAAVHPTSIDRWPVEPPPRLVPLYPGSEVMLIDVDQKKALPLRPGDRVITTSGARALVRRASSIVVYDAEAKSETQLLADTGRFADVVRQGSLVAVGSHVIDVNEAKLLGKVDGRPLALTRDADVLIADGGPPSAERLALGPLRWRKPAAPMN